MKNLPKTMKNPTATFKNHKDPPVTMKTNLELHGVLMGG